MRAMKKDETHLGENVSDFLSRSMALYKDEKKLVDRIAKELKEKGNYKEVYKSVNLSTHRPDEYWRKWYDETSPILQPEIDLITVKLTYQGEFIQGIEIKYIVMRDEKGGLKRSESYYSGIEQALSMLRLGVDEAWLWHLFDENVPWGVVCKYVNACYQLVMLLKLPIGYSAYILEKQQAAKKIGSGLLIPVEPLITPIQASSSFREEYVIKKADLREQWWKWSIHRASANPLLENLLAKDEVKRIREFLKLRLKIPSK